MSALCDAELGCTSLVQHSIGMVTQPVRPLTRHLLFIRHKTEEMIEQAVVQPSVSPWTSPVLVLKDGGQRFCIDYRQVNPLTIWDVYPIPHIDNIHILIKSLLLLLIMGFSILCICICSCNTPAMFQQLMQVVLVGSSCLVY